MSDTVVLLWGGAIGVLASFTASALFLYVLSSYRPRIETSRRIARSTRDDGSIVYNIKVINRTRYPVVGVKVRLSLATPRNVEYGPVYDLTHLSLKTTEVMELQRFDKDDRDARYAVRFRIEENLDTAWTHEETSHLRFQIYAIHSFSGFGKAFEQRYYRKRNSLRDGDFQWGDSFEIS